MNPVDEWWNRSFPPYSTSRLVFLLVATIPIGIIAGYVNGKLFGFGFSWPLTIGLIVMTALIVGSTFLVARKEPGKYGPGAPPPAPPAGGPGAAAGGAAVDTGDVRRLLPVALGCFAFLIITQLLWGVEDVLSGTGLVVAASSATVMAVAWLLRYTLVGPIVLAAFFGFGAALIFFLFTFWLGNESFVGTWFLCSVVAFLFVLPGWVFYMQASGRGRPWMRIIRSREPTVALPPGWLVIGLTCLMVWGSALFARSS